MAHSFNWMHFGLGYCVSLITFFGWIAHWPNLLGAPQHLFQLPINHVSYGLLVILRSFFLFCKSHNHWLWNWLAFLIIFHPRLRIQCTLCHDICMKISICFKGLEISENFNGDVQSLPLLFHHCPSFIIALSCCLHTFSTAVLKDIFFLF